VKTKQPRKVALINVADCPRTEYNAHWQITVLGDDEEGYQWRAQIVSNKPIGYAWKGKTHETWPAGVPAPAYPSDAHLPRQKDYERMTPREQADVRRLQEEFRAQCSAVYEAHPKPVHVIEETLGAEPTRDAADTAAQEWVRSRMPQHRKARGASVNGYAIPLPLDPIADLVRELYGELRYAWRRFGRPLLALAYSTTVRNNRMVQVRDAIDGGAGAGLMRIYDGTRPASCGTATTLLAELTHSDPCAGAPSGGALTFSAITADASANATGTATWYRDVDSTGTCCVDGNVGTAGAELNLNSTSIATGQNVACTSKVYTEGNA
jgi:hypothetical protein